LDSFSQEQDFLQSNLITADHLGKILFSLGKCASLRKYELHRSSPLRTSIYAGAASLYLRGNGAPENGSYEVLATTQEQLNPAPERNPELKRTWPRQTPFLKSLM
jgi:hypothetical protein